MLFQEADIGHFPPTSSETFSRSFAWCRVRTISNGELGNFLSLGKFFSPPEIGHSLMGITRVSGYVARNGIHQRIHWHMFVVKSEKRENDQNST